MQNASGSSAPIGDMMVILGNSFFGQGGGRIFMLVEAFTVVLALIGTTLSCMNTAARVTYAMGKDEEVPAHFGMLHAENLTPHRAIWALADHFGRGRLHCGLHGVRRRTGADAMPRSRHCRRGFFQLRLSHRTTRWRPCRTVCSP